MKNETVALKPGMNYYYVKTPGELEAERQADLASGHYMTDDGETILYSKVARSAFDQPTVVTIIKKRGVEWHHWRKRPPHLYEALATVKGQVRTIMFTRGMMLKYMIQAS